MSGNRKRALSNSATPSKGSSAPTGRADLRSTSKDQPLPSAAIPGLSSGSSEADRSTVEALIAEGNALCDAGNALAGIPKLHEALEISKQVSPKQHFEAALAVFNRESNFTSPSESLIGLSRIRQLAITTGDACSLGALHVAVARTEGFRGCCIDAYRHLGIARRLFGQSSALVPRAWLDTIESSLELVAGNLARARILAESAFEAAETANALKYIVGAGTNLALVALWSGQASSARGYLDSVLSVADKYAYVKIGAIDNLAQLALFEGDLNECRTRLDQCAGVITALRVPARSWYDLATQQTSCAYHERLEDWDKVVALADDCDPELSRRQLKVLRTAILCAKSRALSRLNRHRLASEALAIAIRSCPRGAIDPLIVLEATKAIHLSLSGDVARGTIHFERALAACRAIGHRYHERWIEKDRQTILRDKRETIRFHRPRLEVSDAALLISDAVAILSAGRSLDLLSRSATEILRSSMSEPNIEVTKEALLADRAESGISTEAEPGGAFTMRLRGVDQLISIRVRDLRSLEEISLVRSVCELVRAGLDRIADTEADSDDQNLWPRAIVPADQDAIFHSPRMTELLRIAIRLAGTPMPLLITGETGTGKEVFARLIHEHSQVRNGPFRPYNISAIPRDLVESQLFGHRRGAFTGATDSFLGLIRSAEHGTLFLDEIGDLDPSIQPKLLRFLEAGEIHPLGELRAQRVRVRIVAATNAVLEDRVEDGRFRRDLFYRLIGARLALPPLRERKDEIPALAALFLNRCSRECQRSGIRLGDDLIAALLLYDWPGNIRQLANEIRRVVAMAEDGQTLRVGDLAPEITTAWNARPTTLSQAAAAPLLEVRLDQPLDRALDEVERTFIARAMDASGGRVADAANLLGISRKGLFLKRRKWGMVQGS